MSEHSPIAFYFDFASPYGWLASHGIDGLAAKYGRRVDWRPIMLGAALKVTGVRSNVAIPVKGDYLRHDVARCARLLGLDYREPAAMPMNALAASRAYYWLLRDDGFKAKQLARAVWAAHFGDGRDLSDAAAVAEIGAPLGIDPEALIAACRNQAVKDLLRDETDGAVARGVFGSPFFFVDGEPFWGHDRIDQVEKWMGGGAW